MPHLLEGSAVFIQLTRSSPVGPAGSARGHAVRSRTEVTQELLGVSASGRKVPPHSANTRACGEVAQVLDEREDVTEKIGGQR